MPEFTCCNWTWTWYFRHGICDSEQQLNFGGTSDAFLFKQNENNERILDNYAKEKRKFVSCRYHCGHFWSQLTKKSSWFIIPQANNVFKVAFRCHCVSSVVQKLKVVVTSKSHSPLTSLHLTLLYPFPLLLLTFTF